MGEVRVFINQDECTGCSACPGYSEADFAMGTDGLAQVIAEGEPDPHANTETEKDMMTIGKIAINPAEVVEAAEMCPGECIYVDYAPEN